MALKYIRRPAAYPKFGHAHLKVTVRRTGTPMTTDNDVIVRSHFVKNLKAGDIEAWWGGNYLKMLLVVFDEFDVERFYFFEIINRLLLGRVTSGF